MESIALLVLLAVCLPAVQSSLPLSDPDVTRTTQDLIRSRGFKLEVHGIRTKDGYILEAFRILNPRLNTTIRPVILQHGFPSSSSSWLINSAGGHVGEEETNRTGANLGFELAKRGYDVWLTNSRGNTYSNKHVSIRRTDPRFWDFSYADMGKYDVPANIDYVLKVTGKKDVAYVGYSQGNMQMWVALSLYPRLNAVVRPFVALAPVASFKHVSPRQQARSRIALLLPSLVGYPSGPILQSNRALSYGEAMICHLPQQTPCRLLMSLKQGYGQANYNKTRLEVYSTLLPARTSLKSLIHIAQNVRDKSFAEFDYGSRKNLRLYNQAKAPEFLLEKITNPSIVLVSGLSDHAATPVDIADLRSRVRANMRSIVVQDPKWSHMDFLIGMEAGQMVNQPVIQALQEFDD